jgi:Na+/melibiose symporter-like transporter
MNIKNMAFFAVVGSLALTGFLSGFMVALLHGAEGDWAYMIIYVVACTFGFFMLRPFVKQTCEILKEEG